MHVGAGIAFIAHSHLRILYCFLTFFLVFRFLHSNLSNTNNFLNRSICSINGTLIVSTTSIQNGLVSNDNEGYTTLS